MRYRLLARYQGAPYEAGIGPSDHDLVLFAACPPPEDLGFEPATGHWRKHVRLADVEAVWESRPVGRFGGEPCIVLDDLGDRLHIAFTGHDSYRAEQLGYWEVDRGVFELVTPRQDVTDVIEERVEFPRQRDQATEPGTAVPSRHAEPAGQTGPPGQPEPLQPGQPAPHSAGRPGPPGPGLHPAAGAAFPAVALPPLKEPPLPLEAQALLAASAARSQPRAARGTPAAADKPSGIDRGAVPAAEGERAARVDGQAASPSRRRRARRRLPTQRIFSDLATLAAIPPTAYAVGEEVDGAMCLIRTGEGFEVFSAAAGARLESRVFADEESAYFYLFGVLAAEAVRTGVLAPRG